MGLIPAKTPKFIKWIFPKYTWAIPSSKKVLYLTFDDGPTPDITQRVLDILKQFNAKATFFCIGENVEKHPFILESVLKEKHSVGNHTYHHLKGWETSTKEYLENTEDCEQAFKSKIVNHKPINLFRPPYGKITNKQGKQLIKLGYKIIMWDILSFDWDNNTTKETCLNNVISKAKSGSIIVFHDSVKASEKMMYALPKTLEYFSKQGYEFKAIVN